MDAPKSSTNFIILAPILSNLITDARVWLMFMVCFKTK